jgi:ABC-type branched-subunit amino acid transport system ATPase component
VNQPNALSVRTISKTFGGVTAVRDVSLSMRPGERWVIIGPNGAGKSTLFNLIGGLLRPTSGSIHLFGQDVTRWPPHRRAALGLARTFQITSLFPSVSVLDHVLLAVQAQARMKYVPYRPQASYPGLHARARQILLDWDLWTRHDMAARDLSYGEQRQLEIVLALAAAPRLVLLDEPTAGLSPAETRAATDLIRSLPRDLTILLVEHDLDVAFRVAERVTVMHEGAVLAEGTPAEVRQDSRVMDVYLGGRVEA